jgi:hypothetical protein
MENQMAAQDDVNKRAMVGKLKSAFNSAVFLGYQQSAALLSQALDQVAPLSEAEKKAADGMLTQAQIRTSLETEGKATLNRRA